MFSQRMTRRTEMRKTSMKLAKSCKDEDYMKLRDPRNVRFYRAVQAVLDQNNEGG